MVTKAVFRMCVCCISYVLSGCSSQLFLASNPSLTENDGLLPDKVYFLDKMTSTMSVDGIEISPVTGNEKVLHGHEEIAGFIPYRTWGERKLSVGSKPFRVSLYLRAEGAGATLSTVGIQLFLDDSNKSVYPKKVIKVRKSRECLFDKPPSGSIVPKNDVISLFNKLTVLNESGSEIKDWSIPHWSCVQFYFDIATPDPSRKFRLQLGEIMTPNKKSIMPTIYFSPIIYKQNMR